LKKDKKIEPEENIILVQNNVADCPPRTTAMQTVVSLRYEKL
jgi:hypothetical protein